MRLAEFIETSSEPILVEWVAFAKNVRSGREADGRRPRFGITRPQMLKTIVIDLRRHRARLSRAEKSKGNSDSTAADPDTAAEVHGADRAWSGFTIGEMVSEYRALRASVIRLWTKARRHAHRSRPRRPRALQRSDRSVDRRVDHALHRPISITRRRCFSPCSATIFARRWAPCSCRRSSCWTRASWSSRISRSRSASRTARGA